MQRTIETATVVGGAGFIGGHLVRELVRRNVHVTSLDRDPRGRLDGSGVRSIQVDVAIADRVLSEHLAVAAQDAVFVVVGTGIVPRSLQHPQADLESNASSMLAVLEAVRSRGDTPPVVTYFSSAAVYGNAQTVPMSEEHPRDPLSPYGVSKLAAENYLRLYHLLYGIPTLAVRPFSVVGPGQRKLVVYDLLIRLFAGEEPLVVAGAPHVTRDYVYVEDLARCVCDLALSAPARGEAYNICSGSGTSLGSLVDLLQTATGIGVEVQFTGRLRPGDPTRFVGDPASAAALGAVCNTPLATAVAKTAAWLA